MLRQQLWLKFWLVFSWHAASFQGNTSYKFLQVLKHFACAVVERTQSGSLLLIPERDCVSYVYVFMCFVRLH